VCTFVGLNRAKVIEFFKRFWYLQMNLARFHKNLKFKPTWTRTVFGWVTLPAGGFNMLEPTTQGGPLNSFSPTEISLQTH
jgi:hypothetical protein